MPFHLPPAVPCAQRSNRFDDSRLPRSDVYIYLTDSYRGFPYQRAQGQAGIDDYRAKLTTQVEQVLAAGQSGHVVYVPFNEPEGNMYGAGQYSYNNVSWLSDPRYFFAEWKQVHDLIKGLDPHARIAGPNSSVLYDQVKGFLRYCKVNDCLPDVVTWHELSSPGSVRSKVDADLAYWNIDGNLNDSVAEANKGNGQWWLFNAYGQLTGDTVRVTPPSPGQQYTLQGIATLDRAKRQSRAIFGGASGAADVRFTHVDRKVFGGRGDVVLDRVRTGPAPVAAPARLEAEAGVLTGSAKRSNEFSFASGEVVTAVGDGPENALTLHVTAKQAGQHVLVVRYANAEKSIPTHYNPDPVARHADIAVNGQAARRVLFPTTFHFNQFGQRSKYAPDIDYVTVSPLIAPAG